jgi:hypothetical protein
VAIVAAKYQFWNNMWPEFELNVTWWPDSLRQGSTQLFLTPGVIFRSVAHGLAEIRRGPGYQLAVTLRTCLQRQLHPVGAAVLLSAQPSTPDNIGTTPKDRGWIAGREGVG